MKQKRATRCVPSFCFSIRVIRVDPWPKAFCSQKSSERNRSTQAEPPGPRSCGAGRLFRRHARRKALPRAPGDEVDPQRSEERRVGKESVSTWRLWWSRYHKKKKKKTKQ